MKAASSAFGYKKSLRSVCCSRLQVITKAFINGGSGRRKDSMTELKDTKGSENVHNFKLCCDVTVVCNGVSSSISRRQCCCWLPRVFPCSGNSADVLFLQEAATVTSNWRENRRVTALQLTGFMCSWFPRAITPSAAFPASAQLAFAAPWNKASPHHAAQGGQGKRRELRHQAAERRLQFNIKGARMWC